MRARLSGMLETPGRRRPGTRKIYPLWPFDEAEKIDARFGEPRRVTLQTGFGPSGPPHLGTFGEIVRTSFVAMAVEARGYTSRILAFSDDMDGLRRVPQGFPGHLEEHLGRPLSAIPDPFGEAGSYAAHMNRRLRRMVELTGVSVEFRSATEEYRKGTFDEAIRRVLRRVPRVREILVAGLSEETLRDWFPFMALCEECGRIYSTRVVDYDAESAEVEYLCADGGRTAGCGHRGRRSALGGGGKLPWKIDWAARWFSLGVDYELYGKDLIPSAAINDQICEEIFDYPPPVHMFYELFLDESGAKISKSKGDALEPTQWLRYAPRESLDLLFFDNPTQAKRVSLGRIPEYLRELTAIEELVYGETPGDDAAGAEGGGGPDDTSRRNARSTYDFLTSFEPPAERPLRLDFGLLLNIIGGTGTADPQAVSEYLARTGQYPSAVLASTAAREQIERALDYYQNVARAAETDLLHEEPQPAELECLEAFTAFLDRGDADDEAIQAAVFDLARSFEIKAGRLFRLLYVALIHQPRGPRLGGFVNILGRETAARRIRESLAAAVAGAPETAGG